MKRALPLFGAFFCQSKRQLAALSRNLILEPHHTASIAPPLTSAVRAVPSSATATPRLPVELTFLGTSSASPTETRNVSSLLVKPSRTAVWMFDCGDGTLRQWYRRPGAQASTGTVLEAVFITHCHGDHVYGLPSLLMGMLSALPSCDSAPSCYTTEQPLLVVGPVGLYQLFAPMLDGHSRVRILECSPAVASGEGRAAAFSSAFRDSPSSLLYPIGSAAEANLRFEVHESAEWKVLAIPIEHSTLTLGYVLIEKGHHGRKIVVLGDTCNPYATLPLAAEADCLVHECTFLNEDADQARWTGHSTCRMAGEFARAAQAKTLLLNHFSPRYFKNEYHPRARSLMHRLQEQVRTSFGPSGDVILAHDFMTHTVYPRAGQSVPVYPAEDKARESCDRLATRLQNVWSDPALSMAGLEHLSKIELGLDNWMLSMRDSPA